MNSLEYAKMSVRKLTSFSDRIQADLVKTLLESSGIQVVIKFDSEIGYTGNLFSAEGFHIYVPEDRYEEALQLIS